MMKLNLLLAFAIVPTFDISRLIQMGKNVLVDLIKWAALRVLLISLVTTLVPLAIYAGWLLISESLLTWATNNMTGAAWEGTMVELTGLAGWLGVRLRFVECFQVLSTFLALRFVLGFMKK